MKKLFESLDAWYAALDAPIGFFGVDSALSSSIDPLQLEDRLLSLGLAMLLLPSESTFCMQTLQKVQQYLRKGCVPSQKHKLDQAMRRSHWCAILQWLEQPALREKLLAVKGPIETQHLVAAVHASVDIWSEEGDPHDVSRHTIQLALLSSWLHPLRQSVGSCFATAPAILIQRYQPERFLNDLTQLLDHSRIERIYEGNVYTAPVALAWEIAAWQRPLYGSKGLVRDRCVCAPLETVLHLKPQAARLSIRDALKSDPQNIRQLYGCILLKHLGLDAEPEEIDTMEDTFAAHQGLRIERKGASARFSNLLKALFRAYHRLFDHPLLRLWEFTLASFSEVDAQLCRWSLYHALGLQQGSTYGLSAIIQQRVQEEAAMCCQELEIAEREYQAVQVRRQQIVQRAQRGESEQMEWVRAGLRQTEADEETCAQRYEDFKQQHALLGNFPEWFLSKLDALFQDFFLQVYDPHLKQQEADIQQDSMAGFRLACKYGRSATKVWTPIFNEKQLLEALSQFFLYLEHTLMGEESIYPIRHVLTSVCNVCVHKIRESNFLDEAVAHLNKKMEHEQDGMRPLNLWSAISGGSMHHFLHHYYQRDSPPRKHEFWIESEDELWVAWIEALQKLNQWAIQEYRKERFLPLLVHSPTHAFSLWPGSPPFMESWLDEGYPFTWIRDRFVQPAQQFYAAQRFTQEQAHFLLKRMADCAGVSIPPPHLGVTTVQKLWKLWSKGPLDAERASRIFDQVCYQCLPFVSTAQCHILFPSCTIEAGWITSDECIERYLQATNKVRTWDEWDALCAEFVARGFLGPRAIVLGDTNWTRDHIGFFVSPSRSKLALCRIASLGLAITPLTEWEPHLFGAKHRWGIYDAPHEYGAVS